jgi:MFS transporter, DHA1 family, chloramphenicol/florfenicol resistance protein
MHNKTRIIIALILAPFVFTFAFGLDIYIPLIPQMKQVFHTSQFLIQMTLSLFLLGIAVGELIIGPLSDQFGRFKVSIISILLFAIGSLVCAVATSIAVFISGRIICAIGASGMLVIAFAIVRDLFSGDESAQVYSWLNAAIGISPTFAPIIGGYIAFFLGWHAVFWFLVLMGAGILVLTFLTIRETHPVKRRKKVDKDVVLRYINIFRNINFLRYSLYAGLGVSICFSFFSVSPFILINLLGIKEQHFGYYFACFGLVLVFGGIIAGKVVYQQGVDKTIHYGVILVALGGTAMLVYNILFGLHAYSFLVTMAIACTGAVFIIGAAAAGAMEPFPEIAGTAAASLQAMQFLVAAGIGSTLMLFPIHSSIPYAICLLLIAFFGVLLRYLKQ